jgi:C1A family cysteine protease
MKKENIVLKVRGGGVIIMGTKCGAIPSRPGRRCVVGGWHPDIPDLRDQGLETPEFQKPMKEAKALLASAPAQKLPRRVDNRSYCSPMEDQQSLGSCTAQAVVGMLEYMMRRGLGEHTDLSRLFLYKVTRRLLGWTGDVGADIRTTIKAAACFGVPPELHWPYDVNRYEDEPDAFLYSYADRFKALKYARLDPYNATGAEALQEAKRALAAKFVIALGFPVYTSMTDSAYVPYPTPQDKLQGGHAILAVGYDDEVEIEDASGARTKDGCLIFRNSWGEDWGENGYGYLPYRYVVDGLAVDLWTVYRTEWLDPGNFS